MARVEDGVEDGAQQLLRFQNVADSSTTLQPDAMALQAAQAASQAEAQSCTDIRARRPPVTLASEQHWQNTRLSDIQATAARLVDSAALFQAMGAAPSGEGGAMRYAR